MKRFISIFWILICTLSVFQNGHVSAGKCIICKFGSILTPLNSSITTKLNTDKPLKSRHSMTLSLENSISVKASLDHYTEKHLPTSSKPDEEHIKSSSPRTSVADLSPDDKESFVLVFTSMYGHLTDPIPTDMVINLVGVLACSPKLFSTLTQPCLNSALSILAVNQCALHQVPPKESGLFLKGLLSLSPGVLNSIPKSSFVSILGMVSSTEFFNEIPQSSTMNLITALSMSKSSVNCLPLQTLLSLLSFIASKTHTEFMMKLPPSTHFGFLDGLLDTLDDSSPFLVNTIPTSVLVTILSPAMTSRMLSVLPISSFDSLVSVLGSSQALSKDLPVSNFISMINILITSPKILGSLNPNNVAKMLSTVATCPSIFDSLPSNLMHQLFESITVYLPSSLACITANEYSILFGKKN
ncbi:uncharacterized protein LOC100159872 [Acyrthosiphon pisum]|uniref:Uncharacterized protein n=1 Tax=Acyrthosiphon pisum TaxID=7029 RepID=A0A8R2ABP3_ACYPI|nr:uncharacterized protein LOC100159872 [Acyrthosiphon pisum]|eukprot:XP_001951079.2 PREDICTED: uncharacterized protein LOC100159872 [Acyrthosiphon pisum]